jgi:xanthine dehydrogenase accessory factor
MKTWALAAEAVARHGRCAVVTVLSTKGSAPRDAGACMVVTAEGYHGTIGGGALEWRAIATAQAMLSGIAARRIGTHALGPELGQCCGGQVEVLTEVFDISALTKLREMEVQEATIHGRKLLLFGAGHVGRALVLALAPLPFDVMWIDNRPHAFPHAVPGNVTLIQSVDPSLEATNAPDASLIMVMTHSHALDLAIVDASLRNARVAHTGLIGSATKRARFEKRLLEGGVLPTRVAELICPIGLGGIRSKEPAAIAAATVAQLLILHERLHEAAAATQPLEDCKRHG